MLLHLSPIWIASNDQNNRFVLLGSLCFFSLWNSPDAFFYMATKIVCIVSLNRCFDDFDVRVFDTVGSLHRLVVPKGLRYAAKKFLALTCFVDDVIDRPNDHLGASHAKG